MTAATVSRSGDSIPHIARSAAHSARTLRARADAAQAVYIAVQGGLVHRFGRPLPTKDPLLFDVLAMIDVGPGDVWTWRGRRNNKGLGTVRRPGDQVEISVVRYLAVAFGVIQPDDYGMLYPGPTGPLDVNPWHRKLRASSLPHRGNPDRFKPQEVSGG